MAQKTINNQQQRCLSQCIFKHWGQQSDTAPARREQEYAQCLTDCRLCE
jgi:hypothetical protein